MAEDKVTRIGRMPKSQKITIKQRLRSGETVRKVEAPLPEGFGISVGSSFTDPQNIDLSGAGGGGSTAAGLVSSGVKAAIRRQGFGTKVSQRSNIFYAGPEPTEISFEMIFHSYYSAFNEVLVPVVQLMAMSVGRQYGYEQLDESTKERFGSLLRGLFERSGDEEGNGIEGAAADLGFMRGPEEAKISFGNTFTIKRGYVSSVGVQFSNVLDNEGIPTSATCAVTVKVIRNPTQSDVLGYFDRVNSGDI